MKFYKGPYKMRQSAISTFKKCPYAYKLQYLDELKTIPSQDPQNALVIGTALHYGCETRDLKQSLDLYYSNYYLINDLQVNEEIKLTMMLPKVWQILDEMDYIRYEHEVDFELDGFHGTADLLAYNQDGSVDLYDFKYSNNVDSYMESPQLHIYKYYLEKLGYTVNRLGFIFIPKTFIRQKKTESIDTFRMRLKATLADMQPQVNMLEYDAQKVADSFQTVLKIYNTKEFEPAPSKLCDWCQYKEYCTRGVDYMIIPENTRRTVTVDRKPDLWIYGGSYTGKTTFADQFDNNLMFNTDGNVDMITSPVIRIKDTVEKTGRTLNKTFAWQHFKNALAELEAEKTTFEVITIDLVEDMFEHCRLYMYDKHGWEHEQDGGYGKGYDMIQLEFLSTMKRLKNIGYRIILISKLKLGEVTRGSNKITTYAPNINPKLAEVIAGIVDMTVLVEADGNDRTMNFKVSPYIFGGSRFNFGIDKIELNPAALEDAIKNSTINFNHDKVETTTQAEEQAPEPQKEAEKPPTEAATGRRRRRTEDNQ